MYTLKNKRLTDCSVKTSKDSNNITFKLFGKTLDKVRARFMLNLLDLPIQYNSEDIATELEMAAYNLPEYIVKQALDIATTDKLMVRNERDVNYRRRYQVPRKYIDSLNDKLKHKGNNDEN